MEDNRSPQSFLAAKIYIFSEKNIHICLLSKILEWYLGLMLLATRWEVSRKNWNKIFLSVKKNYLQHRTLYIDKLCNTKATWNIFIYVKFQRFLSPGKYSLPFWDRARFFSLSIPLDLRRYLYENSNKYLLNGFFFSSFLSSFFSSQKNFWVSTQHMVCFVNKLEPALAENVSQIIFVVRMC